MNSEDDRWENEGGAVGIGSKEPVASPQPAPKFDAKIEYVVLIAGLLIGFGLLTLMMTIGARREDAEMAATMTLYGCLSVALGAAVAAMFWLWRTFQECRPE